MNFVVIGILVAVICYGIGVLWFCKRVFNGRRLGTTSLQARRATVIQSLCPGSLRYCGGYLFPKCWWGGSGTITQTCSPRSTGRSFRACGDFSARTATPVNTRPPAGPSAVQIANLLQTPLGSRQWILVNRSGQFELGYRDQDNSDTQ